MYEPIIGQDYSIIGRGGFDGQHNVPGYAVPNWAPAPGLPPYPIQQFAVGEEPAMPPAPPAGMMWPPGYGYGFAGPVAANLNATASLIAAKDSALVVPNAWNRAHVGVLGYPSTTICPGETKKISTKSMPCLVKVRTIVIPEPIAAFLLVESFFLGKWALHVTSDPVPALMFSQNASNWLKLNPITLNPGVQATIEVTNTSNAKLTFHCGHDVTFVESDG